MKVRQRAKMVHFFADLRAVAHVQPNHQDPLRRSVFHGLRRSGVPRLQAFPPRGDPVEWL